MGAIFFTGFPGFLGSELLPRIVGRSEHEAVCLVQPKFRDLAEKKLAGILHLHPALSSRVRLVEGDITLPLDHLDAADIREIYHLAAVYDLAVSREIANRVNVLGTARVLDLAERATSLARFHYVSTCYVSGRYHGVFREEDLDEGQVFNNFYEETKMLAELDVRSRMRRVPTTIYRPAVVVGDSVTGVTQKFDGPYFVIRWLLRQPRIAILPVVGRPKRYTFNVVPRDFVLDAIEYLSGLPRSEGKTYALADPRPLTVDETIRVMAEVTGQRVARIPLTRSIAKGALAYLPGLYRLMKIPPQAVDYFVHPTTYDTSVANADLADSGISVPPLREYAPRLIEFARRHPEISSAAMA